MTSNDSGNVSRFILPVLGLLGLTWFCIALLMRRPEAIVKDSPDFVGALKIWQSVIFSKHSTPRSTKRFMNYVRYLAMRQRPFAEKQSPLSDFFHLKRHKNSYNSSRVADQVEQVVPDEVLVALAALEGAFPEWLRSDDAVSWPHITQSTELEWRLADNARQYHEALFKSFDVLKFRKRFLQMSDGCDLN
jgi:hypothetical protein